MQLGSGGQGGGGRVVQAVCFVVLELQHMVLSRVEQRV